MLQSIFSTIRTKYKNLDYETNGGHDTTFSQKMAFLFSKRGAAKIITVVKRQARIAGPFKPRESYELQIRYPEWLAEESSRRKLKKLKKSEKALKSKPMVSVLLAIRHDADFGHVKRTVDSIKSQIYKNWEICISSTNTKKIIQLRNLTNSKIKQVSTTNEHDYNAALNAANGEYILTLGIGDVLRENSLLKIVSFITQNKEFDLLYSDDDQVINDEKYNNPHFKPDFCEDNFLCSKPPKF